MSTATKARTAKVHLPQQNPLLDAEQILLTDGWITGSMMKCGTGERCAVGALRAACGISEHSPAQRKRLSETYVRSLHLLAAAINPHYKGSKAMQAEIRCEVTPGIGEPTPKFDTLTPQQQVDALESFIIQYNDGRVENQAGRNAVLRKFVKAAKAFVAA